MSNFCPGTRCQRQACAQTQTQSSQYSATLQKTNVKFKQVNIVHKCAQQRAKAESEQPNQANQSTTRERPLYRSTCVSRHLQLKTARRTLLSAVLLPTCPCWRQPAQPNLSNYQEMQQRQTHTHIWTEWTDCSTWTTKVVGKYPMKSVQMSGSPGYPAHNTSTGVSRLASPIFWYRSLIVSAFRPCHGRLPRRKYISRWPTDSRSSRRLCSTNMHTHTHTDLKALFPGLPGWAGTRKVKQIKSTEGKHALQTCVPEYSQTRLSG